MTGLDLAPYKAETLFKMFSRYSRASLAAVEDKRQCAYIAEYLSLLGAKTIIAERDYIDRDYLEDFSGYYIKCFNEYPRKCTRLHFLSKCISDSEFLHLLQGSSSRFTHEWLQQNYLGFIVIKPLPNTLIGRACLQVHPLQEPQAHFPALITQSVNLFGFRLHVRTLPFQEQDSVVAACATSALWSAFQLTGRLFQHQIPTPVEITRLATEYGSSDTRHLPTRGLTPENVAQAIRAIDLEPFSVQADKPLIFMPTVYAYLRGQIPVFMTMALYDPPDHPNDPYKRRGEAHGVLVTGYRTGRPEPMTDNKGFLLEANRLSEIYVHDDQVGPFCRSVSDWKPVVTLEGADVYPNLNPPSLLTAWWAEDEGRGVATEQPPRCSRAVPELLMMPLYPTIRIPYGTIEAIIREFDAMLHDYLEKCISATTGARTGRPVWDIYLTQGSDIKSSIITEGELRGEDRSRLLMKPLPRFIWRATARLGSKMIFDILFDATDIQNGHLLVYFIEYERHISGHARDMAWFHSRYMASGAFKGARTRHLLALLAERREREATGSPGATRPRPARRPAG